MTTITYQNKQYQTEENETVLDSLLRNNIDIPYACKAGVCHVCVMACEQGEIEPDACNGLPDIQIDNGYFLACQCAPKEDLVICDAIEADLFSQARIISKEHLSDNITRIKLKMSVALYYRAGQFINIRKSKDEIRSYSLASLPTQDNFLELHIKRMKNGLLSNWLCDDINIGDVIEIQGPFGDCFYQPESKDNNMLMIATGSGLAPLIGILREAIESNHQGKISLYHGDRTADELYLHQQLKSMAAENELLSYYPCVSSPTESNNTDMFIGRASTIAMKNHKDLSNYFIYLCGSPEMVETINEQSLIKNANDRNIFADPFVTKDLRLGKIR